MALEAKDIPPYVAVFVAFMSLIATLYLGVTTNSIADRNRVADRTAAYIKEYKDLVVSDDVLLYDTYKKSSGFQKVRVEILFGLLVSTIDAMNVANDGRASLWAKFLSGIPGPLIAQPSNTWTSNPETISQIKAEKAKLESEYKAEMTP